MVDTVSKNIRSKIMRQVKGNNTTPEKLLRRAMWRLGLRGWRLNKNNLFGKPDIVFSRYKLVVFVDGCFWHGCPSCYRQPKSNVKYWKDKIKKNKVRDNKVTQHFKSIDWKVVRFWEHQVLKSPTRCANKIKSLIEAC